MPDTDALNLPFVTVLASTLKLVKQKPVIMRINAKNVAVVFLIFYPPDNLIVFYFLNCCIFNYENTNKLQHGGLDTAISLFVFWQDRQVLLLGLLILHNDTKRSLLLVII